MISKETKAKIRGQVARALVRVRRTLPPGTRLPAGILLMAGGTLGFLPVLGFWMIPLGVGVAALDVKPGLARLRRWRAGVDTGPKG
jgi:hypothetical protein